MSQTIGAAISFGIAASIPLWVHMGIMIGIGAIAFTAYLFLRWVLKSVLNSCALISILPRPFIGQKIGQTSISAN